jgi:hypothetical protein
LKSIAATLIGNKEWSPEAYITQELSYCFVLRLARYGYVRAEHSIRILSSTQKQELLDWIIENEANLMCFGTGARMELYAGRGLYKFSPERIAIADGDIRPNFIDSPGQITVGACWGFNRLNNSRNAEERASLRDLILRADFERGRRVLLNAISGGTAPVDSVWTSNFSSKDLWKKSFIKKWESQEQSRREQYIHVKQPNHIVPDIRRWSEEECIAYNMSFGGIDCILGINLELNEWSNDRLTGYDGKHKLEQVMTEADWANICYYQADSVLFLHKATNDMRAAATNLFTNNEVLRAYRLEKGIAEDVDDRIVVADVVLEFFQQMVDYLRNFPTQENRMSRYEVDPFISLINTTS